MLPTFSLEPVTCHILTLLSALSEPLLSRSVGKPLADKTQTLFAEMQGLGEEETLEACHQQTQVPSSTWCADGTVSFTCAREFSPAYAPSAPASHTHVFTSSRAHALLPVPVLRQQRHGPWAHSLYLFLEAGSGSVFAEGIHEGHGAVPLADLRIQTDDVLWPLPSGRPTFTSPFLGPAGVSAAS